MLAVLFTMLLAQAQPMAKPVTLDQAVGMALERNPDLRRQVLLSLSAEQDKVISRSAILPSLGINASFSDTAQGATDPYYFSGFPVPGQPSTSYQSWSGTAQLRQLIFDGGKWWNNLAVTDLANQSGLAQVDEQKLQITYLVEQRFYELVRAQRQLGVLTEAAMRSRDQAEFVQKLFEGGRQSQADVYAARANRDNDEVNRLGQERAVELARADLALAIGIDPSEPLTVAEPQGLMQEPAQPPKALDAVAKALDLRPSIKAASLTLESNRKAVSAANGDYWPTISVAATYSRNTVDATPFFERLNHNATLSGSVNLSWNVFNGLNTTATVRKAELQAQISENDLSNARRNVASDVEKAVAQLATARAQVRVAQQSETTAREGLRLAKTRQEVGVGTQLEVRDAELKLTQAQLNVVGSLVDGREAEAALRRAVGG